MASNIVAPNCAGDLDMCTPADSRASNFSAAPPLPPATMAPAWPMRRPGGAVVPAMKPTTGLFGSSFQAIDKVGPVEGISTDTHTSGLAKTGDGRLMNGLVR
jgi:hypothetical protein